MIDEGNVREDWRDGFNRWYIGGGRHRPGNAFQMCESQCRAAYQQGHADASASCESDEVRRLTRDLISKVNIVIDDANSANLGALVDASKALASADASASDAVGRGNLWTTPAPMPGESPLGEFVPGVRANFAKFRACRSAAKKFYSAALAFYDCESGSFASPQWKAVMEARAALLAAEGGAE